MICAITGSSGVLGSYIIKKNPDVKFLRYLGDITNKNEIKSWILKKKFDYFLHLAAIVPTSEIKNNYLHAKKVNYYGTKNIVDALLLKRNVWFFFASSSHVYSSSIKKIKETSSTKSISLYGKLKCLSEKYILKKFKNSVNNYCIGRIFSFTDIKQASSFFIPFVFYKLKREKNKK